MGIWDCVDDRDKDSTSMVVMMKCLILNNKSEMVVDLHERYKYLSNDTTKMLSIKACMNTSEWNKGRWFIDGLNINDYRDYSIEFLNTLIDFYGKVNDLEKALSVFDSIGDGRRTIVSISVMMKCFIGNKYYDKAVLLYERHKGKHNDITHLMYIKACMYSDQSDRASNIIHRLESENVNKFNIQLITTLIEFYSMKGDILKAHEIFEQISKEKIDCTCIAVMMNGCIGNNEFKNAMLLYEKYPGIRNDMTDVLYLKACMNNNDWEIGLQMIDRWNIININQHSIEYITTLIDFYGKMNNISKVMELFEGLNDDNINDATVSVVMNCYVNGNKYNDAILLFEKYFGNKPQSDILNILYIKACGNTDNYSKGHHFIELMGTTLLHSDELITTCIDFYGRHNCVDKAFRWYIHNSIKKPNNSFVGAMMNAYKNNKQYYEALDLFFENINPDIYMYSIALHCCGEAVLPLKGQTIIDELINNDDIFNNISVQAGIISMYAKCSEYQKAIDVYNQYISNNDLNKISKDNGILRLFASIMYCHAKIGNFEEVSSLYNILKSYNIIPNNVINCIMINACAHSGNYTQGLYIFRSISSNKSPIHANIITTMIDCLCRCNQINEAEIIYDKYYESLHYMDKLIVLTSMLSSFRSSNDTQRVYYYFKEIQKISNHYAHDSIAWEKINACHTLYYNMTKSKDKCTSKNI